MSREKTEELICHDCGIRFTRTIKRGQKPKHCPDCADRDIACGYCGDVFKVRYQVERKYCTQRCAAYAQGKYTPKEKVCEFCGEPFLAKTDQRFREQKYCSHQCKYLARRTYKGTTRKCKECGAEFEPNYPGAQHCGYGCAKLASQKTVRGKIVEKICQACSKKFTVDGAHMYAKYCCRKCRDSVWRNKRRAMEVAATVEEFPALSIFEKNGWCCQLCGKAVNKKLKYPHPKSASLDHIMPLSKGGKHARDNVQLAHLNCNVRKGNRRLLPTADGQLMFV